MVEVGREVWMNGEWMPFADAQVPILTHSLHYGLAIFEGIRCYDTIQGPQVFRLHDHTKRFIDSCKIIGMPIDLSVDDMDGLILEAIRRNEHQACYVRPLAYYGDDKVGLDTRGMRGRVAIITWEWGAYLGEEGLRNGIRIMTSSYTRHHPNIMLTRAKVAGNYVNSQLAKAEAVANGYAEALMLDPDGYVVEGSGENLFLVEGGRLVTPGEGSILPGITRDCVMNLARDLGIEVVEERITRGRVFTADEVFMTGTAAEITPIREVDRRTIGEVTPGPLTRRLQSLFFEAARGEIDTYMRWLTPVPTGAGV